MNQVEHKRIAAIIEGHFDAQLAKIPREITTSEINRRKATLAKSLNVKTRLEKITKNREEADRLEEEVLKELQEAHPRLHEEASVYNRGYNEPNLSDPQKFMNWLAIVEENRAVGLPAQRERIKEKMREALAQLELIVDAQGLRALFDRVGIKVQHE